MPFNPIMVTRLLNSFSKVHAAGYLLPSPPNLSLSLAIVDPAPHRFRCFFLFDIVALRKIICFQFPTEQRLRGWRWRWWSVGTQRDESRYLRRRSSRRRTTVASSSVRWSSGKWWSPINKYFLVKLANMFYCPSIVLCRTEATGTRCRTNKMSQDQW